HLLPQEIKNTHKLRLKHNHYDNTLRAYLLKDPSLLQNKHFLPTLDTTGMLHATLAYLPHIGQIVHPEDAWINKDMRGKGLGKALYEAIYSHAFQNGATHVAGDSHSTLASHIHQSLAKKHNLNYVPVPNFPGKRYESKQKWENTESGPYDFKYKPYTYELKSENEDLTLIKEEMNNAVEDMLGMSYQSHFAFEAAKFLANAKKDASFEKMRHSLFDFDGDIIAAALDAYDLPVNVSNRKALEGILNLEQFNKSEDLIGQPADVVPLVDEAISASKQITRAFATDNVERIILKGKHSKGTSIARDPKTNDVWLLKPGTGKLVTSGANEEKASQSRRETCYYGIAKLLNLDLYIPEAELLSIDGKEIAAIKVLPSDFKNLE
ncbi:MAG: GNAT family N-acetyltransferase, partial [Thaumarchaeota archaeon]|nr:GNAT family N-acetyltransferase [Nitrososphaerota archaeon]